ncbi:MAG: hypothetical protein J6V90_04380 [Treponema sp.]|nr:hypothetical protein [Treponema sp.]
MKLYDYILKNFNKDEPFFVSELNMPGSTKNNIRQALKVLCDKGLAIRYDTGIYYIPHDSPQTEGLVKQELQALGRRPAPFSDRDVAVKKYICDKGEFFGYYTGFVFANAMGFTTQVPIVREIASNNSGGLKRKVQIGNSKFILKKPRATITTENHKILQFLDLMNDYDFYYDDSAIKEDVIFRIKTFLKQNKITQEKFEPFLSYYPDSIYKTLYRLGTERVFA